MHISIIDKKLIIYSAYSDVKTNSINHELPLQPVQVLKWGQKKSLSQEQTPLLEKAEPFYLYIF